MPRAMPRLAAGFQDAVTSAVGIAEAGEIARALSPPRGAVRRELTISRLEALHEMAYLRIFVEWENFLEATFLRMMCGYQCPHYVPTFPTGKSRQPSLGDAQRELFGGRDYLLWHNPGAVR